MCPTSELEGLTDLASATNNKYKDVLPPTRISQEAFKRARMLLTPAILDHSIRVYLLAAELARSTNSVYIASKHNLLFVACLFHDIGTTDEFDGPLRFEIGGADAAVDFLTQHADISEVDKHDVWTAIACHTSPQIAERIGELSKLVRLAVITDFGRKSEAWDLLEPIKSQLDGTFERAEIEKVLGDVVVEQAKKKLEKAPMVSWPGLMLKAHLAEPDWDGVNKAF